MSVVRHRPRSALHSMCCSIRTDPDDTRSQLGRCGSRTRCPQQLAGCSQTHPCWCCRSAWGTAAVLVVTLSLGCLLLSALSVAASFCSCRSSKESFLKRAHCADAVLGPLQTLSDSITEWVCWEPDTTAPACSSEQSLSNSNQLCHKGCRVCKAAWQ